MSDSGGRETRNDKRERSEHHHRVFFPSFSVFRFAFPEFVMSRIRAAFEKARGENRAAFIAYLTAGDPDADPIVDGPVLQRAAGRALSSGTTLTGVFEIGCRVASSTRMALVLFSYLNPLLRLGIERASRQAQVAGFDAALVTDLPPEEAGQFQPAVRSAGLDTVFLVSPTSPDSRMNAAARLSSGFLYVVSRPGTTGARRDLPADLSETIRRARRAAGSLPIAVGFGIATPAAARRAARLADGVIVGSALVRAAEEAGDAREKAVETLASSLRHACRRGKGVRC